MDGTSQTLEDMLWRGFAEYVTRWCHYSIANQRWYLDDMANELFAIACNYETHRTF